MPIKTRVPGVPAGRSTGFHTRPLGSAGIPTSKLPIGNLQGITVELVNDQIIQTVEETEDGLTVTNQRGETFTGKAVIGADGLKSNARKYFADDEPICSEYVAPA